MRDKSKSEEKTMTRWTVVLSGIMFLILVAAGCSGGSSGDPVNPGNTENLTASTVEQVSASNVLWGYYDLYFNFENGEVEAVPNKSVSFNANVVQFVNSNPANLGFSILETPVGPDYVDVDIDVSITHPFAGLPQYNGYDVRGVFIANGSSSFKYDPGLKFGHQGTDATMFPDPDDGFGGPDGCTRWFNPKEFTTPGLFGYTPGAFATPGFSGTATVNPYKLFGDGLGKTDDAFDYVMNGGDDVIFSSGQKNTRNYYLRFPLAGGVMYNYAIVASWKGEDPADHPANTPEAVAIDNTITDNIFYVDPGSNGGKLKLDFDIPGSEQPSTIIVESNVIMSANTFDPATIATGGDGTFSSYHVEIPADNVLGTDNNEYWIIAQYDAYGYSNDFGVPNSAGSDSLTSYFKYVLFTADTPYNQPPDISSGVDGEAMPLEWSMESYSVTATDSDGDPLTYIWTITDGNGDPVEGYDGVNGDGAGNLDVDWGEIAGWTQGATPFDIDCVVDDGTDTTDATTLECEVWINADLFVSNNADFAATPDNGTQTEPYSTITQAINAHSAGQTIAVDYGTGTYTEQVATSFGTGFTLRAWSFYTEPAARPTIEYQFGQTLYIYYTNDVTIQGFAISPASGNTSSQMTYAYYSHNLTYLDCHFTGTLDYYYFHVLYIYYCNDVTVKNCLFSDLNTNYPAYSYAYLYLSYIYRGNGTQRFIQNEVTELQESPQVNGYMYMYNYGYYWPAGSEWSNNLYHHISPNVLTYAYMYLNRVYYPYPNVYVHNNTVDSLDEDLGNNTGGILYPMYLYNGGSPSYSYDAKNNIVSNIGGTNTVPTYYGMYCYNISPDYSDVYNIQDSPYPSAPPGPNCISSDPLYVNNTTAPYDYHLDTGSPCIGTGEGGVDMGCYGDLPAGETVGLLTPE
jgi:hypothetical protein